MNNNGSLINNDSPYVTVVCITFEHQELLIDALNSVLFQSYNNLDLVVVEDKSSNKSSDTLTIFDNFTTEYSSRFRHTTLVQNEVRQGLVKSLNIAISLVRTDYLTILSGDDILPSQSIELNMSYIHLHNVRFVGGRIISDKQSVDNKHHKSNVLQVTEINQAKTTLERKKIILNWLERGLPFLTTGVIFETKLIMEMNEFDEEYYILEDSPLIYKLILSGQEFYNHSEVTYIYRIGIGVSSGSNQYLSEYLEDLKKFYNFVIRNSRGLDSNYIKTLLVRTKFNLILFSSNLKLLKILMLVAMHPIIMIRYFEIKKIRRMMRLLFKRS